MRAYLVGPVIGERRQELVKEVAVGTVQLVVNVSIIDCVVTSGDAIMHIQLYHLLQPALVHLPPKHIAK